MKHLFILLTLVITSCTISDQEKDIRIYYINGGFEDITVSTVDGYKNQFGNKEATIYFSDGCLYTDYNESKYRAHFIGCIRCGVKDYQVLAVRKIKNK